jgi:histidine ammonia-lyase
MIPQYTPASIASQNKQLAPASVDTLYLVMDKKTMLVWGNAATKLRARKLELF